MTRSETISALAIIATFFPFSFSLSDDAMVDVWHRELEPYDSSVVDGAVRLLCRERDKFPTLKDVLDRLDPQVDGAAEAWATATRYASEWADGPVMRGGELYTPPGIQDQAIARAIEAVGGVPAIRARTLEDEPGMRAHFFRAYDEARTRARRAESLNVIQGGRPRGHQLIKGATQAIARPVDGEVGHG